MYFIPKTKIHSNLKKEGLDLLNDEIVNKENFDKPGTEIQTYESIEDKKKPRKISC